MKPKSEDLQDAFGGENADEAHVEVLQGEDPHLVLAVVVQGHGQHVQPNEDHDDHVKLLVRHNSEHNRLRPPLKKLVKTSQYHLRTKSSFLTLGLGMALTGFFLPIFFMAA